MMRFNDVRCEFFPLTNTNITLISGKTSKTFGTAI